MTRSKVYIRFPKTGLGNMLLVWSRGYVFAHLNGLPLITSGWGGIRWGAWLRWERKKRVYWGYFREDPWWERMKIARQQNYGDKIFEPAVAPVPRGENGHSLFVFDQISPQDDLFGPIRSHRSLVRKGLYDMLLPALSKRLELAVSPEIAVHIRRGDFKIGNPITPTEFFIRAISLARSVTGRDLSVTVFTDANREEIGDVLALPGVSLAEAGPDILDILLMSRSKVIVLSRSSTFSYWGAFLSDAVVIKPAEDWQGDLRPAEVNKEIFEGKVDFNDEQSVNKLKAGLKAYNWQEK